METWTRTPCASLILNTWVDGSPRTARRDGAGIPFVNAPPLTAVILCRYPYGSILTFIFAMTALSPSSFSSASAIDRGTAKTLGSAPNNAIIVNEPLVVAMHEGSGEMVQERAIELDLAELAECVRQKLKLAVSLACQAEQERRLRRWTSAQECQRQWEQIIVEVKGLLPQLKQRGVALYP